MLRLLTGLTFRESYVTAAQHQAHVMHVPAPLLVLLLLVPLLLFEFPVLSTAATAGQPLTWAGSGILPHSFVLLRSAGIA
jgi:hypothetical protein